MWCFVARVALARRAPERLRRAPHRRSVRTSRKRGEAALRLRTSSKRVEAAPGRERASREEATPHGLKRKKNYIEIRGKTNQRLQHPWNMEVKARQKADCDHVCGMYARSCRLSGCVCRSHTAVPAWLACLRSVGRPACLAPSLAGHYGGTRSTSAEVRSCKRKSALRARLSARTTGTALTVRVCRSNMLSDGEKREEERLEQERTAKMGPVSVRFSRCAQRPPLTRAHLLAPNGAFYPSCTPAGPHLAPLYHPTHLPPPSACSAPFPSPLAHATGRHRPKEAAAATARGPKL